MTNTDLSPEAIAAAAQRTVRKDADLLGASLAKGLEQRVIAGDSEYLSNVSKFTLASVHLASQDLVDAGWVVQYGACTRGGAFDNRWRAMHVMTKAHYLRNRRSAVESGVTTGPIIGAVVCTIGLMIASLFLVSLAPFIGGAIAIAAFLAIIVSTAQAIKENKNTLSADLEAITLPTKPIHADVAWTTWYYYHQR